MGYVYLLRCQCPMYPKHAARSQLCASSLHTKFCSPVSKTHVEQYTCKMQRAQCQARRIANLRISFQCCHCLLINKEIAASQTPKPIAASEYLHNRHVYQPVHMCLLVYSSRQITLIHTSRQTTCPDHAECNVQIISPANRCVCPRQAAGCKLFTRKECLQKSTCAEMCFPSQS